MVYQMHPSAPRAYYIRSVNSRFLCFIIIRGGAIFL